ncbi:MAG TPA: beta-N-acetylhexosaminidase [Acidimicrobiales bacterium]|nr:beta-N-acetylhexosaminidase [Acidimicrobiales bacterium]
MIPRPRSWSEGGPGATLADGMMVAADDASSAVAGLLAGELGAGTGWRISRAGPGGTSPHGTVRLRVGAAVTVGAEGLAPMASALGNSLPNGPHEGYTLRSGADGIEITGASAAGVFYGTRTLRQLLPPDLLRVAPSQPVGAVELPGTEISDAPRFGWRGLGLDVSRHFLPKDFILKLVDVASLHKINVLHLHLTDDQGWRFPVDRYPRLTEVGAWRRESPLGHYHEGRTDGTPHGGYYTKGDLAEICAYAARRFVTVVPEVDMPGHMQAAVAAYPELGNTGEPLEVFTNWGVSEHVLNMDASTVRFCAEVLEEVMDVFPGRYVHIGGDECPTTEWEANPASKAWCEERGLTGPHQLQSWFTGQMSLVVRGRGRVLLGWDEVLDAGAPPGAVIVAWRAEEAARVALEAARSGHDVVMAPEPWCYFDWAYADDAREPLAIRAAITVQRAFELEPVPPGLPEELATRVLGAQAQLWTEYVLTGPHAEYMYWPRACALAEATWTVGERPWDEFERRLRAHMPRLAALGVNYRPIDGPTPGQARTWRNPGAA